MREPARSTPGQTSDDLLTVVDRQARQATAAGLQLRPVTDARTAR
jgi:hypothetical protein